MADRKMVKVFKIFLIKNNAYNKYCNAMLEIKDMDKLYILRWLLEMNIYSYLSGAFTWGHSEEGRVYWSKLSDKWIHFLYKRHDFNSLAPPSDYMP